MIERRFQVFISSTFRDLVEERQAVLLAIQKLNHFPAGMELFPSANAAPWELIARIVAFSDYYVLIIGGRYGSTDENGISFTEKEHRLAVEHGIPVLAFLHRDPGQIRLADSEIDPASRTKLDGFRRNIEESHHCIYWKNAGELATAVVVSLVNEIAKIPRVGWVRGDLADERQELLKSLEMVRRENDQFREKLQSLSTLIKESASLDEICQGSDPIELKLHERVEARDEGKVVAKIKTHDFEPTWHELFMLIAWQAASGAIDSELKYTVARHFGDRLYMDDETWQMIATQFLALDLLAVRNELRTRHTGMWVVGSKSNTSTQVATDIWYLTERGLRLFAHGSAIKRN